MVYFTRYCKQSSKLGGCCVVQSSEYPRCGGGGGEGGAPGGEAGKGTMCGYVHQCVMSEGMGIHSICIPTIIIIIDCTNELKFS